MMSEEKGGYKRNNRRMVRPKDKGSDESDEDYKASEDDEFDESDDEYGLTFHGDESEEIFDLLEEEEETVEKTVKKVDRPKVKRAGRARRTKKNVFSGDESEEVLDDLEEEEGKEDEEEEIVEKKVKRVGGPKVKKGGHARGTKKNGALKLKKKRRILYREEEDEDEEDDNDDDDEEEEEEDEEEEIVEKKVKRVGGSKVKKGGRARGRKKNGPLKPKKKWRILYREEDDEDEEDDNDDENYDFDDEETNKVAKLKKKTRVSYREEDDDFDCADDELNDEKLYSFVRPRGKNRVSYRGEDDDDDYDGADNEFNDEKLNSVVKPRGKKRVSEYDDDYNGVDDEFKDEKVNSVVKQRRKRRVPYREEDNDDYSGSDAEFDNEKVNSVVKPRGKKRVSYREEDDGDYNGSDDEFNDEKVSSVVKPRGKKRVSYREEDDGDYNGSDDECNEEKVSSVMKLRGKKRASYREEDDNFDVTDDQSDDGNESEVAKPSKKKEVSYGEEDDADDYTGGDNEFDNEKVVLAGKPRGKRRVSYRVEEEDDDDDDDYTGADDEFDDEMVNSVVNTRGKRRASNRVEDDDDDDDDCNGADDEFDDEKVNLVVKPRGKRTISYREEYDDYNGRDEKFDDGEKVSKVAKPRKKKEISYWEEDDDCDGTDDDDDDYDAMDDGDDDEEFTPNEIDGVDDEDELLLMKENKKLGRPRLKRKGVPERRKRKRDFKVPNTTSRTKPIKNRSPSRKGKTGNAGEFLDTKPIVEEKDKKVNGRRRRRGIVHSDSDVVISRSSDYEYTISEEEREQIQEANKFCRSLTTTLRSSTSSNKLEEEMKMPTQRKRLAQKGKQKVKDLKVEAAKQVCGICLTDETKRKVRGTLNCCSHYFCFACIMEWSKVESRCPLCKQRFSTISKPARSNTGFDLRTVVTLVPERDQVYQPSEEELLGFLDPYDYVICTECHHGGDDALMLLCDLCDSPAHTYCVGLGREVPEGNWYCEGCRPAALGSSNPQVLTPIPSSPVPSIRETFDLNEMYVPDTPLVHESSQLPSPRPSVGDVQLPSPTLGSGAVTVFERRRIQHQIHQLLNNRRRQMDDRTLETPTTVSGHSLFGAQVSWSRELGAQHVVSPETMSSSNIYFHGSLQDNTIPIFQNPEVRSARLTHIGGHFSQNQPSTSTNGSFGGYMQNEITGLNPSIGLRLGHQQLQPCSSRSTIGSDASGSSYPFRETTVPPRTLQEALRTQF